MLTCGGGGLRDILIDSDVYAYASVDQMLSGKQYKRTVGVFKWCEQNAHTICRELWNQLLDVQVPVGE